MKNRQAAAAGLDIGRQAAAINLAKRTDDGASREVKYIPGNKPGDYRPTPPDFTPGAFAQWGTIRPFVLKSAAQFRPQPPLDPKTFEGQTIDKDVVVDADVRTPDGQTTKKTLTITISRVAGSGREGRPIITKISGL